MSKRHDYGTRHMLEGADLADGERVLGHEPELEGDEAAAEHDRVGYQYPPERCPVKQRQCSQWDWARVSAGLSSGWELACMSGSADTLGDSVNLSQARTIMGCSEDKEYITAHRASSHQRHR